MPRYMRDPPPPAPVSAHQKKPPRLSLDAAGAALLHRLSTFQTVSVPVGDRGLGVVAGVKDSSEGPPTLVTQGCDGGSSTARPVVPSDRMQEKAPVSPSAPNMLCPCEAIFSKTTFSACT